MTFLSPTGKAIRGTLETLSGVARIEGIADNGEPVYSGETEIWWDEQKTVRREGQRVFVDVEGDEWVQSQLVEASE